LLLLWKSTFPKFSNLLINEIEADNMALESVERTEKGYLVNANDWNEEIAVELFAEEGIEPTDLHWDIVRYVREETLNGDEPNERSIMKAMGKKWGRKVKSKEMYELFPLMPSKQGLKIGGCPQSTRKGGY
jgi:tRNA 2-thiouridine synthesizing protein E